MSAEIEYFKYRPKGKDVVSDSSSVLPGSVESIEFFGPSIQILISCGIDNISSTIRLLPGRRRVLDHLQAILFRDENDEKGKKVRFQGGEITIEKSQELKLVLRRGSRFKRLDREVFVYLSPNEDGVHDEVPQESNPLVLV